MCNLLGLPFEIPYKVRETSEGRKIYTLATVTMDEGGNVAILVPEPGILQLTRAGWKRLTSRMEDQILSQQKQEEQAHG